MSAPDNLPVEQELTLRPARPGSLIINAVVHLVDQDPRSQLYIKTRGEQTLVGKWGAERFNVKPAGARGDGFIHDELYDRVVVEGTGFFSQSENITEPDARAQITDKVASFVTALGVLLTK